MLAPITPTMRQTHGAHLERRARLWGEAARSPGSLTAEPAYAEPLPPVGTPFDFYGPAHWRNIVRLVALRYGTTVTEILSPTRSRSVTSSRHVAIYLVLLHFPDTSGFKLGRMFGRDHATIFNSLRRAPALIEQWRNG